MLALTKVNVEACSHGAVSIRQLLSYVLFPTAYSITRIEEEEDDESVFIGSF